MEALRVLIFGTPFQILAQVSKGVNRQSAAFAREKSLPQSRGLAPWHRRLTQLPMQSREERRRHSLHRRMLPTAATPTICSFLLPRDSLYDLCSRVEEPSPLIRRPLLRVPVSFARRVWFATHTGAPDEMHSLRQAG